MKFAINNFLNLKKRKVEFIDYINSRNLFFFNKILLRITKLPSFIRKLFLLFIDLFSILIVVIFSNLLLNQFSLIDLDNIYYDALTFASICLPIYFLSGQYKALTKFSTNSHIFYCLLRNILALLIIFCFRSSNFLYFSFIAIAQALLSFSTRIFLSNLIGLQGVSRQKKIVIYGAGLAGAELANSLILNREYNIIFFVDDDPSLRKRSILGIPIKGPKALNKYNKEIDTLFLAISKIDQNKKKYILNQLYNFSFKVLVIPSLEEIISGKAKITEARSVQIEDLISRDIAKLNRSNVINQYQRKTILITGGGGSIGSEIAKQILQLSPKTIIILDFSEFNLYSTKNKLTKVQSKDIQLIYVLGNCCNERVIKNLFEKYKIDILIHCAAYKHVPLVESNALIGLENNILSSKLLANEAVKNNIEKAVLISSDKAVRPTNIMGASKRVAELIFLNSQNSIKTNKTKIKTKFSIVRFGNVLGSSGSVIPYFINQINCGGPVTVTHPEITRYFMTIEEATLLVLEASSFSKGGELFLLDMGEPIKIVNLAKKLLKLNGLSIKDSINKNGDIEIKFIGLREGEKLFEELLVDGTAKKTDSKYIFLGNESKNNCNNKSSELIDLLVNSLINKDKKTALSLLKEIVPEWEQNNKFLKKN